MRKESKKIVTVSSMIIITCVGVLGYLATQGLLTPKSMHERYKIKDYGAIQAIKSDFMQDIGASCEHDGITFTVDHIIVDEKRLMILYTIKSNRKKGFLNNMLYEVCDGEGNALPLARFFPTSDMDIKKNRLYQNHLNFVFEDSQVPDRIQLNLNLRISEHTHLKDHASLERGQHSMVDSDANTYPWHVSFPINHQPFQDKKIVYDFKKSCIIDNQKIYIHGLTIYPTIAVVNMSYDQENTKEIFELVDFSIMEHDKTFGGPIGGLVRSGTKDHYSLYLESNYFGTDSKQLSLTGKGIKALSKHALQVIVNIDNKKIIQSPDNQIEVDKITNEYISIKYPLDGLQFDTAFVDGEGQVHETNVQSYESDNDGYYALIYLPEDKQLVSPLTLTIISYPTITEHPFEVKILE